MHTVFEDSAEAGKRLSKHLSRYHQTEAVILAIARGGVPVAVATAHRVLLPWNVLVVRKLPVPWHPDTGFGAVAADGSVALNEGLVHGLGLRSNQMNEIIERVRGETLAQSETYSAIRPELDISGTTVVLVDDGLASGYTMLAAIESARAKGASKVVAAAPVASRSAAALVQEAADETIFELISPTVPFSIADFYLVRRSLTDEDIVSMLRTS